MESPCYSDPNFAIICGFFEKFGKMCGVQLPMVSELVMMLECEEGVPQDLATLHTQLLRKIRRTTSIEKWERTAVKFCQAYLQEDANELDERGYLGCSIGLKLRLLRALLETQFDLNSKFKSAINLLAADELRQKPLGKDSSGRIYWCHLDAGANLKVFREDPGLNDDNWSVVAHDRSTMVDLIQTLTGDNSLDLSPIIEPPAPVMDTGQDSSDEGDGDEVNGALSEGTDEAENSENVLSEGATEVDDSDDKELNGSSNLTPPDSIPSANGEGSNKRKIENSIDEPPSTPSSKKLKVDEDAVSEAIEEPLMLVQGEGSGAECEAGELFQCSDVIEEEVFYVRGEGSGAECSAGNHEEEEVTNSSQQSCGNPVSSSVDTESETYIALPDTTTDQVVSTEAQTEDVTGVVVSSSSATTGTCQVGPSNTSDKSSDCTSNSVSAWQQADTSDSGKPKVWSIDDICSSTGEDILNSPEKGPITGGNTLDNVSQKSDCLTHINIDITPVDVNDIESDNNHCVDASSEAASSSTARIDTPNIETKIPSIVEEGTRVISENERDNLKLSVPEIIITPTTPESCCFSKQDSPITDDAIDTCANTHQPEAMHETPKTSSEPSDGSNAKTVNIEPDVSLPEESPHPLDIEENCSKKEETFLSSEKNVESGNKDIEPEVCLAAESPHPLDIEENCSKKEQSFVSSEEYVESENKEIEPDVTLSEVSPKPLDIDNNCSKKEQTFLSSEENVESENKEIEPDVTLSEVFSKPLDTEDNCSKIEQSFVSSEKNVESENKEIEPDVTFSEVSPKHLDIEGNCSKKEQSFVSSEENVESENKEIEAGVTLSEASPEPLDIEENCSKIDQSIVSSEKNVESEKIEVFSEDSHTEVTQFIDEMKSDPSNVVGVAEVFLSASVVKSEDAEVTKASSECLSKSSLVSMENKVIPIYNVTVSETENSVVSLETKPVFEKVDLLNPDSGSVISNSIKKLDDSPKDVVNADKNDDVIADEESKSVTVNEIDSTEKVMECIIENETISGSVIDSENISEFIEKEDITSTRVDDATLDTQSVNNESVVTSDKNTCNIVSAEEVKSKESDKPEVSSYDLLRLNVSNDDTSFTQGSACVDELVNNDQEGCNAAAGVEQSLNLANDEAPESKETCLESQVECANSELVKDESQMQIDLEIPIICDSKTYDNRPPPSSITESVCNLVKSSDDDNESMINNAEKIAKMSQKMGVDCSEAASDHKSHSPSPTSNSIGKLENMVDFFKKDEFLDTTIHQETNKPLERLKTPVNQNKGTVFDELNSSKDKESNFVIKVDQDIELNMTENTNQVMDKVEENTDSDHQNTIKESKPSLDEDELDESDGNFEDESSSMTGMENQENSEEDSNSKSPEKVSTSLSKEEVRKLKLSDEEESSSSQSHETKKKATRKDTIERKEEDNFKLTENHKQFDEEDTENDSDSCDKGRRYAKKKKNDVDKSLEKEEGESDSGIRLPENASENIGEEDKANDSESKLPENESKSEGQMDTEKDNSSEKEENDADPVSPKKVNKSLGKKKRAKTKGPVSKKEQDSSEVIKDVGENKGEDPLSGNADTSAADPEDPLATPASPKDADPLAIAPKKKGRKKKMKQVGKKQESEDVQSDQSDKEKTVKKSKPGHYYIPAREIQLLGGQGDGEGESPLGVRQSRRIAVIKLKEAEERRRQEEIELEAFKSKKVKKKSKSKHYDEDYADDDDSAEEMDDVHKKKSKKEKKFKFDPKKAWLTSSDDSEAEEDVEPEEDEIEEDHDEPVYKSDHEFSPESDIEDLDYQPVRVARTAQARKVTPDKYDDVVCEVCEKSNEPEWILLCDGCDKGSHTKCLLPPLHLVPEGEWFCPPCSLQNLVTHLKRTLREYDRCEKQRENEELRKRRLAFVGISLDNVLPPAKKQKKSERSGSESDSGSGSGSSAESKSGNSSDESTPFYQLRERRTNTSSYRFNEYDDLIRSAIRDEMGEDPIAEQAADIPGDTKIDATEKNVNEDDDEQVDEPASDANMDEKDEIKKTDTVADEKCGEYSAETDNGSELDEPPPVVPRQRKKQKKRKKKLLTLDFSSDDEDDQNSDSDFKGSSLDEDEEDFEEELSDSDLSGVGKRRKGKRGSAAVRRSTRARNRRIDKDFINDETSDDGSVDNSDRKEFDTSESSDSDRSWGRKKGNKSRKRRPRTPPSRSKRKSSKTKKKKSKSGSDEDRKFKKKGKKGVKYGLDSDPESKITNRRTRGKQINFVWDNEGTDSEEERMKRKRRTGRVGRFASEESDEEFKVLEDEKVEEDEEEDVEEFHSGDDDSSNSAPMKKKPKVENPVTKSISTKKGKTSAKPSIVKKKKKVASESDDDLKDLDEEAEEELMDMLDKRDMPVEELKEAIKKTKEKKKIEPDPPPAKKKGCKVKITPTRAEIAEKAAAAKAKKTESAGLLKRTLEAAEKSNTSPQPSPSAQLPNPALRPLGPSGVQVAGPPPRPLLGPGQGPQLIPPNLAMSPQPHLMGGPATMLGTPPGQPHMGPMPQHPSHLTGPPPHPAMGLPPGGYPPNAPRMPMGSQQLMQMLGPMQRPPHPNLHQLGMPPQPSGLHPMAPHGGQPPTMPLQQQGVRIPMGGQFPPQAAFPGQGQYPNSGGSPNFAPSPDPKQRRKPGPKPGSKNKKKSDVEDSPVKGKGRNRKSDEVTIATVQAPTQFPETAVTEEGSVITRMLNSTESGVATERAPGHNLHGAPRMPLYHPPRPMDPSPSGGGTVAMNKPSFPPNQFPPQFQNFHQPHFPGFSEGVFPPDQGLPGPQGPVPMQVPSKAFEEEEGSEFGGLASYFASQAEEDMDT